MIAHSHTSWLRIIFSLRDNIVPKIYLRMLVSTALAAPATYLAAEKHAMSLTPTPFVLLGVPLGIFLGFRNNASYDRFWEGRRLWGQLVNTSRTFARQVLAHLVSQEEAFRETVCTLQARLIRRHIAFVHALRKHLRDETNWEELTPHLGPEEVGRLREAPNVPNAILHETGLLLSRARRDGHLHLYLAPVVESSLVVLADVQGGCERIKNTPIPFSYTVLIHRIVALYCVLLPFGIAEAIGIYTPLVVLFVSFALFGLDAIGDEIENPFGHDQNDLPLSFLSRSIEAQLLSLLGDTVETRETDPPLPEEAVVS